jgi:hypothetical protein
MSTTSVVVVVVTVALNAFSGIAALLHWKAILPGMAKADVPESWLTFPIGTLKTTGAAGLLAGLLIDAPWLVAAAATGWCCSSFVRCTPMSGPRTTRHSSGWPSCSWARRVPPWCLP